MPLVRIRYNEEEKYRQGRLAALQLEIRVGVAKIMSSDDEGGQLTLDEIEVQFDRAHPDDANGSDFMIDIEAVDFPGRLANRQERCDQLKELFAKLMGPTPPSFGVWLKLVPASYAEYVPAE